MTSHHLSFTKCMFLTNYWRQWFAARRYILSQSKNHCYFSQHHNVPMHAQLWSVSALKMAHMSASEPVAEGLQITTVCFLTWWISPVNVVPFSTLLWEISCAEVRARFKHVSTGQLRRPFRFLILTLSEQTSGWPGAAPCHAAPCPP